MPWIIVNELRKLGKMAQVLRSEKVENDDYFWRSCGILGVDFIENS